MQIFPTVWAVLLFNSSVGRRYNPYKYRPEAGISIEEEGAEAAVDGEGQPLGEVPEEQEQSEQDVDQQQRLQQEFGQQGYTNGAYEEGEYNEEVPAGEHLETVDEYGNPVYAPGDTCPQQGAFGVGNSSTDGNVTCDNGTDQQDEGQPVANVAEDEFSEKERQQVGGVAEAGGSDGEFFDSQENQSTDGYRR